MAMAKSFGPALRKALRDLLGPEARGMTPMVGGTPEALARAREQGWGVDEPMYRGLSRPYDADRAGYYQMFTNSPLDASEYAGDFAGANVVPAFLRRGKNVAVDAGRANFNAVPVASLPADVRARLHPGIGATARTDEIAHAAREAGYDSATIKNVFDQAFGERPTPSMATSKSDADALMRDLEAAGFDMGPSDGVAPAPGARSVNNDPVTVEAIFDPKNIRSRFAAFNPAKKDSSDLLASAFLGTTAGAAALGLSAEDAEAMNIGAAAKTWNKVAAKNALAMEKAGSRREQIFKETGTFRGLDGKWRQEIDDSQASLTGVEKGRLSEVLDHPALFEAYPKLARLPTKIGDSDYAEGFHFALPGFRRLEIKGPTDQKRLSGVLHEAQHAVQDAEGFSPGGSPMPMWLRPAKMRKEYGHVDAFKFYERLPGEMEARLTQARQPLDAALRRELYPLVQPNSYADQQAYGPHGLDYHPADAIQGYKRESPWLTLAKAGGYGYGAYKLAEATLGDEADARPMPRFAAFDPAKKDSSDLLAGLAAGIISLPMLRAALAERRERRA